MTNKNEFDEFDNELNKFFDESFNNLHSESKSSLKDNDQEYHYVNYVDDEDSLRGLVKVEWDRTEEFEKNVLPLVERLVEICEENNIDFQATFVVQKIINDDESAYTINDKKGETLPEYASYGVTRTEDETCFLLAAESMRRIPHQFAHDIISDVASFLSFTSGIMGFMKDLFKKDDD